MSDMEIKIPEINTPEDLAKFAVQVLDRKKAKGLRLLHVFDRTIIADYFVVCTGNSSTQLRSFADEVDFMLSEAGYPPARIEGDGNSGWILLDFSSVIVHIFSQQGRQFYDLEKLYDEDAEVDITDILTED